MKKKIYSILFASISFMGFSQVGINTTDPKSTLDINGSFATREAIVTVSGTTATLDIKSAYYKITGGTSNFTIVFSTVAPFTTIQDGQRVVIYNDTNFNGTYGNFIVQSKSAQEFIYSAGVWNSIKTANSSPTTLKWFYTPSVALDTLVSATAKTFDIYQNYVSQFTKNTGTATYGFVSSNASASTIPYYTNSTDLDYFVTGYDRTVFSNVSITANGLLTYTVISPATDKTFMNIVVVPKN